MCPYIRLLCRLAYVVTFGISDVEAIQATTDTYDRQAPDTNYYYFPSGNRSKRMHLLNSIFASAFRISENLFFVRSNLVTSIHMKSVRILTFFFRPLIRFGVGRLCRRQNFSDTIFPAPAGLHQLRKCSATISSIWINYETKNNTTHRPFVLPVRTQVAQKSCIHRNSIDWIK